MTKKKAPQKTEPDGKTAAAGTDTELAGAGPALRTNGHAPDDPVFEDGPLDDAEAIAQLIELNHERNECESRWDAAKSEAAEAKKELDNASNAISALIDRIDRQRSGTDLGQPVLRTLDAVAE